MKKIDDGWEKFRKENIDFIKEKLAIMKWKNGLKALDKQ